MLGWLLLRLVGTVLACGSSGCPAYDDVHVVSIVAAALMALIVVVAIAMAICVGSFFPYIGVLHYNMFV